MSTDDAGEGVSMRGAGDQARSGADRGRAAADALPRAAGSSNVGHSTRQYRVEFDDKPQSFWDDPENDGLWDADRSLVEDEFDIYVGLGVTNPRIVERSVDAAGQEHRPA